MHYEFSKIIRTIRRTTTVLRPKRVTGQRAGERGCLQLAAERCSADLCLAHAFPHVSEGICICSRFIQYAWMCEALIVWCLAELTCAIAVQLLRALLTQLNRCSRDVIPVHRSSVVSHFYFYVMKPASRCVHVTFICVEAHVTGGDRYRVWFCQSCFAEGCRAPRHSSH
jgi:hypothetical protein